MVTENFSHTESNQSCTESYIHLYPGTRRACSRVLGLPLPGRSRFADSLRLELSMRHQAHATDGPLGTAGEVLIAGQGHSIEPLDRFTGVPAKDQVTASDRTVTDLALPVLAADHGTVVPVGATSTKRSPRFRCTQRAPTPARSRSCRPQAPWRRHANATCADPSRSSPRTSGSHTRTDSC